jgi:cell division septation protein DedD
MVTFRGGGATGSALLTVLLVLAGGCSREQQDWHAAQSAGTSEAYDVFIEQHPDSELVRQAQAQLARFAEDRDFERVRAAGTLAAYQQFLAQHPNGHWAEDARIGIEGFSLGSAPHMAPGDNTPVSRLQGATGVKLLQLNAARETPPEPAAAADESQAVAADSNTAFNIHLASAQIPAAAAPLPAGFAVQLGAFGSPASANAEWTRLQGRFGEELGGLAPRVVAASTPAGQLYRLQVPTRDEAQARSICSSLKQQWQACLAVPR